MSDDTLIDQVEFAVGSAAIECAGIPYASLEDLAKDVGCDRTYVGRMLRLTSLAPDLIEAILRGREPGGMSLEKLRKDLPVRWDEQRAMWRVN